jgi:hypothetical protein
MMDRSMLSQSLLQEVYEVLKTNVFPENGYHIEVKICDRAINELEALKDENYEYFRRRIQDSSKITPSIPILFILKSTGKLLFSLIANKRIL